MNLSRTHLGLALKMLVTTVLATSAIVLPAGIASAADLETPTLTSLSVSATAVTAGQTVSFSYVAAEGAGSLSRLRLGYEHSYGHTDVLTFDGPLPVAGAVTILVPDTWANGLATLYLVELSDASGNKASYFSGGSTVLSPAGATGPSHHAVPFGPGNLTVSGSAVDSTVPSLTSVSTSGSPAQPGQRISVRYEAQDGSGLLTSVRLTYLDTKNVPRVITAPGTGPLPLSGEFDQVIPTDWPDGTYLLTSVDLADPGGNVGTYATGGRVSLSPTGAQGATTHPVSFGPATFIVSGSTVDITPPMLASLNVTGSPMLSSGTATLSYTVTSADPLTFASFTYSHTNDVLTSTFGGAATGLTGTQTIAFPAAGGWGTNQLQEVLLQDSAGNSIVYHRNGTTNEYGNGYRVGVHGFAVGSGDVKVGTPPSAPRILLARARSGSAVVFWEHAVDPVWLTTTRFTITAQPGGRTASFSGTAAFGELTGLTNGTAYRFTVKATNVLGTGAASSLSNQVTPQMSTGIIAGRDFTGDGRTDLIGLKGQTDEFSIQTPYLYRGSGVGGFTGTGQRIVNVWGNMSMVFASADFSGDGRNDTIAVGSPDGRLWRFDGNGRGGFASGRQIGSGWGIMKTVFGAGDFSGDRKTDIIAVHKNGSLYLYRGNGLGGFAGGGQKIGAGWAGFLTVFSPGDFTGDGKTDILAVSKDGGLYLYRGNGRGGFAASGLRIGNSWGGFLSVFSPGDFTGDHRADVLAVTSTGDLFLYRGNGRGGWSGISQRIGRGWNVFR